MRYDRNLNPEWGYAAPTPSVMRTARLIVVATIIGVIAGAATVFSLLNRPMAEESVAARTLVAPDPARPLTAHKSVASQQPIGPQQVESPAEAENSPEQKAPLAPTAKATTLPQQSEPGTISTPQRPTSAAALAEAPAVKDTPSDQVLDNTIAVASDPKSQVKRPRTTSRTALRNSAPRYDRPSYYARGYNGLRYRYGSRYGYEPRRGFEQGFAWAPYGSRDY